MRINNVELEKIKKDIELCLEKCGEYQRDYYYTSKKLYFNWKGLSANYFNEILSNEKIQNEKLYHKIEVFLSIIDIITKKYNQYNSIEFASNFDNELIDSINKILDTYTAIKYKYSLVSSTNQGVKERIDTSIDYINKNIELYDSLKPKIKELANNINENEKYIESQLTNYSVDLIEKTPRVLKTAGHSEEIIFDSEKITLIKLELAGKYKLLNDEINILMEKLDLFNSCYNTTNSSLLFEKVSIIKRNLMTLNSNFINNIDLLNDELDGHIELNSRTKVELKGFEYNE